MKSFGWYLVVAMVALYAYDAVWGYFGDTNTYWCGFGAGILVSVISRIMDEDDE